MKKILASALAIAALVIAYWLLAPFFIDKEVSEKSPLVEEGPESAGSYDASASGSAYEYVASGRFAGFDRIHHGTGTATLIKNGAGYVIRFEDDFSVANGPDLYVGLGKNGSYIEGSEISRLKGNKGSQNYALPSGFNTSASDEVWIWCRAFSVPFAKAALVP